MNKELLEKIIAEDEFGLLGYYGWTNWDTWNANLWLENDEITYRWARNCFSAKRLKELWIENFEGTDDIDTEEVNFEEIYNALNEE